MLPYIEILGHQISMYALCIMAGMILGILVAVFRKKYTKSQREDILFASFYGIIGVIIGGKILYLLTIAPALWNNREVIEWNLELMTALMTGGFVYYGGFIGALGGILLYAKQYRLSGMSLIEKLIPSVPLIHVFGRLGCFCAGCCYGIPYRPPVGVVFRDSLIAPNDIALFPVQLVEAVCNLLLFFVLLILFRKKETNGEALALYMAVYGILRFLLEYIRYDKGRGFILGISVSQWISIVIVAAAVVILFKLKSKPLQPNAVL